MKMYKEINKCVSKAQEIQLAIPAGNLRWSVVYKPYQFQLVQSLHVGDKRKHLEFYSYLLTDVEKDRFLQ